MQSVSIKSIGEEGIVLDQNASIPWSDIKVIGKERLFSSNLMTAIFASWSPFQVYGHKAIRYYAKTHQGQDIIFSNLISFETIQIPKRVETPSNDFLLRLEQLFKTATLHSHIIFEETVGGKAKPLDPQNEIAAISYQRSPEHLVKLAIFVKKSRQKRMIMSLLLFLIIIFSGIALWLVFVESLGKR